MSDKFCYACTQHINIDLDIGHFSKPQKCCRMCKGTGEVDFIEFDKHILQKCECTLDNYHDRA